MADIIKITVCVETIRYFKDEWGIILASLVRKPKNCSVVLDKNGLVTLKGTMPKPEVGNIYNVKAELVQDPKWGQQYEIQAIYSAIEFGEGDKEGQKKFLASLYTPAQVTAMYECVEDPFTALKNKDFKTLVQIKGCGMKTAEQWARKFEKNYHIAKIFVELEDYNLTNSMVAKLMNRYNSPEVVVEKVKNNPYVLCIEVKGIGWKKADKLALDGGVGIYSSQRLQAFIYYYLDTRGEEGHSWITPDELMGAILDEIGEDVPDVNITTAIHEMQERLWWNEDKSKIGLEKYHRLEENLAKEFIRLRDAKSDIEVSDWTDAVKRLEHRQGWKYTDEQKQGIEIAMHNNVVSIVGGGGTGKSSLVAALLEALSGYTYVQTSLSGRAASRLYEITGREGYTIHRLLGFPAKTNDGKNGFTYHDGNQLTADIYIVDEISMIGVDLFYYLLRAIPSGAKLILLGDPGQLESIGCGNVAHDIICSPEVPTVVLTQIHRQAAASAIITESLKVRSGHQLINKNWVGEETRGELQDLTITAYSDISNTYYKVMERFAKLLSAPDFDLMQTQIIAPIKTRGMGSTYELNNAVQELVNPRHKSKEEFTSFVQGKPYVLREGDKVINTVNAYKTDPAIFNGYLGIIKSIDYFEEIMVVDFIGVGEVELEKSLWGNLELGYAISVHKSQGSEFRNVIFAIDFSSYALLSKELIYTGITRASKHCYLIAQTGALRMGVTQTGVSAKQTHLQQCLYDIAHPKLIF